jgi:hypothetical protein
MAPHLSAGSSEVSSRRREPRPHLQLKQLATAIHGLRNTTAPSQVILPTDSPRKEPHQPSGVLLLKPSSGYFPPKTIEQILERLVVRHGYRICSVAWWQGQDLRANDMMSLHYPGFHRVAHGGWAALSPEARAQLQACYHPGTVSGPFEAAFGKPFDLGLLRTPYELDQDGFSPERLNELWELDRQNEPLAIRRIQRLDEDTFALALELPHEFGGPAAGRGRTVILLNGFYAKLEKDFETKGCVALWIQKPAASATSWETLRTDYAGKTNPFQAPPGTIRGDAARGLLAVETVSILANVIHLSANEAEGRREVEQVWWEPRRVNRVFGVRNRQGPPSG